MPSAPAGLRHPLLAFPRLAERLRVQRADRGDRLLEQIVRLGTGQRATAVRLLVDDPGQRAALRPARLHQLGLLGELVDVTDAEVGHDLQMLGQAQRADHLPLVEEADPADAEALGAGGEPQVLDGEGRGVRRHLRLGVAAQGVAAAAGRVGGHDDVDRGVEDRLDLQFLELLRPALGQRLGVGVTLALGQFVHRAAGLRRADDDEVPRLRVADARRGVRRLQHPEQDLVRNRVAAEAVADVPAFAHDPQHRFALGVVVTGGGRGGRRLLGGPDGLQRLRRLLGPHCRHRLLLRLDPLRCLLELLHRLGRCLRLRFREELRRLDDLGAGAALGVGRDHEGLPRAPSPPLRARGQQHPRPLPAAARLLRPSPFPRRRVRRSSTGSSASGSGCTGSGVGGAATCSGWATAGSGAMTASGLSATAAACAGSAGCSCSAVPPAQAAPRAQGCATCSTTGWSCTGAWGSGAAASIGAACASGSGVTATTCWASTGSTGSGSSCAVASSAGPGRVLPPVRPGLPAGPPRPPGRGPARQQRHRDRLGNDRFCRDGLRGRLGLYLGSGLNRLGRLVQLLDRGRLGDRSHRGHQDVLRGRHGRLLGLLDRRSRPNRLLGLDRLLRHCLGLLGHRRLRHRLLGRDGLLRLRAHLLRLRNRLGNRPLGGHRLNSHRLRDGLLRLCPHGAPACGRDLAQLRARQGRGVLGRDVEVLGAGRRRARVAGRQGGPGGAGGGPGRPGSVRRRLCAPPPYDGVGGGRAPVQGRRAGRRERRARPPVRGGRRDASAVEVHGTGVTATGLVRAGRLRGGGLLNCCAGTCGWAGPGRVRPPAAAPSRSARGAGPAWGRGGLRVAPGALGGRHQQKVVVLGSVLGGVEEGVRVRGGDALAAPPCLRSPAVLARDLAGVSHAYPSPIVSAPSALRPGRRTTARRCSSSRTSGLAARHETSRGASILAADRRRDRAVLPRLTVDCATLRVPGLCRTTGRTKTVHFSGH